MPTQASSERCLERAIGAIITSLGRDHAPRIIESAGSELSVATAWGVIEITRFAHVRGDAYIDGIARWHRLPAAVFPHARSAEYS